jgi:pectate lyase
MTRTLAASLFAAQLLGCGTDIAQTATVAATPGSFACPPPEVPPTLPGTPALGGGATIGPWALATGDYGAGQGPGITVAARDAFRLFVNGRLLAESTAPLVPTFVPLTFLPGDNVVAVVVSSASGVPALLLHVDELSRELVSDESVRVSTAPSGDWTLPGFDDSAWSSVVDHGTPASNPDCRPALGLPAGSGARWVTPGVTAPHAAFRVDVRVVPTGYGEGTTGGAAAEPEVVTEPDRLAAALSSEEPAVVLLPQGKLDARRPAAEATSVDSCPTDCPDAPGKVTYHLLPTDQMCPRATVPATRNERRLKVGPNKTIVGLGRGALVRGLWLDLDGATNVILRNVALYDVNPGLIEAGDAISVTGADSIWLDHVTFKWISDGFIDINTESTSITASYLRFDGTNPAACQGRHERGNETVNSVVTFHHNLFSHLSGRSPLVTHALSRGHLFNNVFTDTVDYTIGAGCGAALLVEGNSFESTAAPTSKRECSDGVTGVSLVDAVTGTNLYAGATSHEALGVPTAEPHDPVPVPSYAYTLDPKEDVRFRVGERAGAGARWALPVELD